MKTERIIFAGFGGQGVMSMGQMIDDIKLACECKVPVKFFGKAGGVVPTSYEITDAIKEFAGGIL